MKYSKDLDEDLKALVVESVKKAGLENVVEVKPIRMVKSSGAICEVIKGNALTELFAGEVVAVAIFEDAMLNMTDEAQAMLIEGAVSQIVYDFEKDKLQINKPELNIPLGVYRKYGDEYVKTVEAGLIAVDQVNEQEKLRKEAEKEAKKKKKN
jgi:hypothetical protein